VTETTILQLQIIYFFGLVRFQASAAL